MPQILTRRSLAKAPVDNPHASTGAGSLKAHAAARGLLTGCAVNARLFREDEGFRNLLADQYNIVVPENCLKWNLLRPTADTYNFADPDSLIAFAEAHAMKVRGHNFVWHEAIPSWFAGTVTKDNAQSSTKRSGLPMDAPTASEHLRHGSRCSAPATSTSPSAQRAQPTPPRS
jgi:endo-1,4-beta-xylanase